jgi:abequosyltransferase
MQKEMLKLSICIPTYCQAAAVKVLLQSIVPQYFKQIEVIILDDSPDDATEQIVQEFQNIIPIRYFHGRRKGLDSALIFLTEQARGDFVWWIGDDILLSGAIQEVLSALHKNPEITFLWVNSVDISNSEKLAVHDVQSRFFYDRNDVLSLDIGLLGFITATIFKREVAISGLDQARQHIGSAFVCMYIVLYVIAQRGLCYYLGKPCFASHPKPPGEVRWYDQIQVFGINLYTIVTEFNIVFDKKVLARAISKNLNMVLKAIIVERALGLKTGFAAGNSKIIPLMKIYWSYFELYKFLPLLLLPTPLLKILYKIFKAI